MPYVIDCAAKGIDSSPSKNPARHIWKATTFGSKAPDPGAVTFGAPQRTALCESAEGRRKRVADEQRRRTDAALSRRRRRLSRRRDRPRAMEREPHGAAERALSHSRM